MKRIFESKSLLQLKDIIENADENQSFVAQELRNDFASYLGEFLIKGLRLRSIDRTATTAAQERAISDMEPCYICAGRRHHFRRGEKVTASDLEKYQSI